MPIERLHSGPRMSQAVIHHGTIYLAGQVGGGVGVAEQTPARATVESSRLASSEFKVEIAVIAAQG